MTDEEFAEILGLLEVANGKAMSAAEVEVYHRLLSDLPVDALRIACLADLSLSKFRALPSIGRLRAMALDAMDGERETAVGGLELLRKAISRFGYLRPDEALASLPPITRRVARAISWRAICDYESPQALSAHFVKLFERFAEDVEREAALPPALQQTRARLRLKTEAQFLAAKFPAIEDSRPSEEV